MSAWSAVLATPTRAPAILLGPAGRLGGRCLVLFLVLNFPPLSRHGTPAGPSWAIWQAVGRGRRKLGRWRQTGHEFLRAVDDRYCTRCCVDSRHWTGQLNKDTERKEEADSAGKTTAGDHANQGKVDGRVRLA